MSDGANSNGGGQSARERLDALAASLGERDSTARLATAMAASLDAVESMVGRHGDFMLAAMEAAVATQTDVVADRVKRFQEFDARARRRGPRPRDPAHDRRDEARNDRSKVRDTTMTEPKLIYLGTIQVEEGNRLVLPALDLGADPAAITAALEAAEAKRVADRMEELRRLREMFLPAGERKLADVEPPEGKPPIARDILRP